MPSPIHPTLQRTSVTRLCKRVGRVAAVSIAISGVALWALPSAGGIQSAAAAQPAQARALRIVVTVPPLAGIVRELAPEGAQITTLLSPGKSEHGYEFTPAELAALGRADLIVYVGLDLEPQVDRFLSRNTRGTREVVQLARELGIASAAAPAKLDEHGHPVDDYDHDADHADHDHHHHAVDPHLWLDPVLVKQSLPALAKAIDEAVANVTKGAPKSDPARLDAATRKVDELDRAYASRLAPFKGRSIVTHHAAFGRLAERYGLKVAEVIRPMEAAEPTPGQIAEVVSAIKRENVKVIFVEPQFNPTAAKRIAEAAGVKLGTLDPLGDGDWFKMMRANLDELVDKLGAS